MNIAVIYILISVLGGAVGQILLKKGHDQYGSYYLGFEPPFWYSVAHGNQSICFFRTGDLCNRYSLLVGCTIPGKFKLCLPICQPELCAHANRLMVDFR